ncbi:MAG: hypothetical protein IT562_02530 [Alphaproteobacteria bacterium]|nr:hypothetical protein [Alphaproteobacteria bacterium]
MRIVTRFPGTLAMTGACVLAFVPAAAAQMKPPADGTKVEYDCSGSTKQVISTYNVNGDRVRVESMVDGKSTSSERPYWLIPTTVASMRDRGDGKGPRAMSFDAKELEQLKSLNPNSKLSTTISESGGGNVFKWNYTIAVGQPSKVTHPALGEVDAVEISERRSVIGGNYSASSSELYAIQHGISVRYEYKDNENRNIKCELKQASK